MRIVLSLLDPNETETENSHFEGVAMYLQSADKYPVKLDFMNYDKFKRVSPMAEKRGLKWTMIYKGIPRDGRHVEEALKSINDELGYYGVEVIRGSKRVSSYWGDVCLLYANAGDTYNTTVCYDTRHQKWFVSDWGSWLEKNEKHI